MKTTCWPILWAIPLMVGCTMAKPTVETPAEPIAQKPDPPKKGCMDRTAVNFNLGAKIDDGSCRYDEVVTDYFCSIREMATVRIGMNKLEVKNKLGVFPFDILGADDGCEVHIYHARTAAQEIPVDDLEVNIVNNDGFRVFQGGVKVYRLFFRNGRLESILSEKSEGGLPHELACLVNRMPYLCASDEDYVVCSGCTDPAALNYDAGAEEDNGSCEYYTGCTDPTASNYDRNAVFDNGQCFYIGCTDPQAINFNAAARHKQSACEYCPCDTETHYYVQSDNPNCTDPCIKMERSSALQEKPECSWCELLNGTGGASLQIMVDGVKMDDK